MLQNIVPELLSGNRHLGLMLDYDGTLTPIVSRPEDALIAPERVTLLKALARCSHVRIAIVSGRSVQQLENVLGELLVEPVYLCGLHGGEVKQYPEGITICSPSVSLRAHLSHFKDQLVNNLNSRGLLGSVLLEDKIYSLALHYRLTPIDDKESVIHCFENIYHSSETLCNQFRLQPGKEVIELLPKSFNKGACVQFLVDRWQQSNPSTPYCCLYAGDDLTDEHAFEAIRQLGGHAVRIGEQDPYSKADIQYDSVDSFYLELECFLSCLSPYS